MKKESVLGTAIDLLRRSEDKPPVEPYREPVLNCRLPLDIPISFLEKEMFEVLDLICAEWDSDPMSVQCFDLRIIERAKKLRDQLKPVRF